MDKNKQIIEACEKVLNGIEDESISGESALLICKKIARLTNDNEAMTWLSYEASGYKQSKTGNGIEHNIFMVGWNHGRGYYNDGKEYMFTELISELENAIDSHKLSLKNFTTSGASVAGDHSATAMANLTSCVSRSTSNINTAIREYSKKRSMLMNEYYNYAHKKYISILFGNYNNSLFVEYQNKVNNYLSSLDKENVLKLDAIQNAMNIENHENYSQALTTCRKLYDEIAKDLFFKVFGDNYGKEYKTLSGKEIDVSGDHTLNQLSAVVEKLESKSVKKTIIGSSIVYLLDWLENISNNQSKGVHHTVEKEVAEYCIIQTYVSLAGIINLYVNNKDSIPNDNE